MCVKSQIHAGGRGKGRFKELGPDAKGGVRIAKSIDEVIVNAREMLGKTLVTKQTGPAGKRVNRLYIEDGADIARELYLSLLVDRSVGRVAFVGVDGRRCRHRNGRGDDARTGSRRSRSTRLSGVTDADASRAREGTEA